MIESGRTKHEAWSGAVSELEHVRGLARRWSLDRHHPNDANLGAGELAELLGWVRRRMRAEAERIETPACIVCGEWPTCYGKDDKPRLHCDQHCSHDDCGCRGFTVECAPNFADREALAHAIMTDLDWEPLDSDPAGEHRVAWTLCELAGWPS